MAAKIELVAGDMYRRVYESVNYRLRTAVGGRFASHCRPTNIAFLMTNLCNARCVHCDIWKNKGRDDTPTAEQYKTVLSDLREWLGPVHVYFTGGEALLRPHTPEVVSHASNIGLWTEILTHGYWDDQSRIEKLALANPRRITVSLDGVGEAHTKVRGREKFFEKTTRSLETFKRLRAEQGLRYAIRLKTVIMRHNLDDVHNVAHFAAEQGFECFYQAVEQNYNTPEDPRWFDHSDNWPQDPAEAEAVVRKLMALKKDGLPIRNTLHQLEVMIPYFYDPDSMRLAIQSHTAHQRRAICTALTSIQVQPNGDILTCYGTPVVGNIREKAIREIWESRPNLWDSGCCMENRCSPAEKEKLKLTTIGSGIQP